jgi:hypothetical protein
MMDAHPSLAIPPETGFLPSIPALAGYPSCAREEFFDLITHYPEDAPAWEDYGIAKAEFWNALLTIEPFEASEGVRAFYRLYAAKQRKPRYGEKTPGNCEHLRAIGELLPEAHFIHVIRDGRDVALSLRPMWFAPGTDIPTLATYWRRLVLSARSAAQNTRAYMEVRYEDVVRETESTIRSICRFINLDFDREMLSYWLRTPERLKEHKTRVRNDGSIIVTHEQRLGQQALTLRPPERQRVFRWKQDMTRNEQDLFLRHAGDLLEELGYQT